MPLLGANGGLLGAQRTTTTTSGVGLWTPNEQVLLRRVNTWPRTDDPYSSNVSLLLHMDGSNGSTTFTDSSSNALTVTANGNAQISTAQSKFGGASGAFDGTGDFLAVAYNTALNFGTSDFTIEMWIRPADLNYRFMLGATVNSGGYIMLAINPTGSGQIWLGLSGVSWPLQFSGHTLSTNTWAHLAITRSGSSNRLFIDGSQIGSTITNSQSWSVDPSGLYVGNQAGASSWNGYIDDLRITKGVARYTANFTPPTAPFPNP
jgi:hypothetical protein